MADCCITVCNDLNLACCDEDCSDLTAIVSIALSSTDPGGLIFDADTGAQVAKGKVWTSTTLANCRWTSCPLPALSEYTTTSGTPQYRVTQRIFRNGCLLDLSCVYIDLTDADCGNTVKLQDIITDNGGGGTPTMPATCADLASLSIGCLGDVSITGITPGQMLVWNGSSLVPGTVTGGGTTALQVSDTNCIDMTLSGSGAAGDPYIVSASPIVSTDAGNALECRANGLYVTSAGGGSVSLNVADSDCIDMTLGGSGSAGDPWIVSAAPIISPADANCLVCLPDGLAAFISTVHSQTWANIGQVTTDGNWVANSITQTSITDCSAAWPVPVNGNDWILQQFSVYVEEGPIATQEVFELQESMNGGATWNTRSTITMPANGGVGPVFMTTAAAANTSATDLWRVVVTAADTDITQTSRCASFTAEFVYENC